MLYQLLFIKVIVVINQTTHVDNSIQFNSKEILFSYQATIHTHTHTYTHTHLHRCMTTNWKLWHIFRWWKLNVRHARNVRNAEIWPLTLALRQNSVTHCFTITHNQHTAFKILFWPFSLGKSATICFSLVFRRCYFFSEHLFLFNLKFNNISLFHFFSRVL